MRAEIIRGTLGIWGRGGIGRRTRFRFWRLTAVRVQVPSAPPLTVLRAPSPNPSESPPRQRNQPRHSIPADLKPLRHGPGFAQGTTQNRERAVRTAGDPPALRTVVEREMRTVGASIPVGHLRTVDEVVSQSLARENFNTLLLTLFAAICAAARGYRHLRADLLRSRAAHAGDRHPSRTRGRPRRRAAMIVMQGAKLLQ